MRDLLDGLIAKFNAKVDADPDLKEELGDLKKTVLLELRDGTKWHFTLMDQHIQPLVDGPVDHPDLTILVKDADTLRKLILREIGPFKAYATGDVKFKGSFDDLLRFRKFF